MTGSLDAQQGRWKRHFSHEELLSIIHYDPETGEFTWLKTIHSRAVKGTKAGTISKRTGYVSIQIFGYVYKAHRLAWFYQTGTWPLRKIDHRDRVKNNNRFVNLRDVSHSFNMQNQALPHEGNASGFIGVSFHKASGKWAVQLRIKGQTNAHHGLFDDPEEASKEYLRLKDLLHEGWSDAADKNIINEKGKSP